MGAIELYKKGKLSLIMIMTIFMSIFAFLPVSDAHILIIGDSEGDLPQAYDTTTKLATTLKSKGYDVVALYGTNATSKNILKGMYDADAVIYSGHGGYESGHYDMNGGTASPPFALVGSDNFIWSMGDQMREGWNGKLFTAPFKQNIPVFILCACFSTGRVEDKEVANPIETIYNYASMYIGAGANYYATCWNDGKVIYDFLDGATSFAVVNNMAYEKIAKNTVCNGTLVWRNDHGYSAFIGDWSGTFPTVAQTTAYNDAAAEKWYDGNRIKNNLTSRFTISGSYHINQLLTFIEQSIDTNGTIINYSWNFGDGTETLGIISTNQSHVYTKPGTYTVKHTITDNNSKTASSFRTITIIDTKPVVDFYRTTNNLVPKVPIGFRSSSYDPDIGDGITSYSWNFGDGSSTSGNYVQHTYAKDGTYTVTLTVKDTFGETSSKSVKLAVISPKPDLVVTKAYKSGGYLHVTVKNQGKTTSRACYTRAWYGTYYKNIYTYGLKSGTYKTYKVSFKYKHGKVKADYNKKNSELNENNNGRSF